jgi:hypothetical protein
MVRVDMTINDQSELEAQLARSVPAEVLDRFRALGLLTVNSDA